MQVDDILGYSPRTYMMGHGGIYAIRNLVTGRVYIGQTISFFDRYTAHKLALRNGAHGTRSLQADWDRLGAQIFKFDMFIAFRYTLFVRGYIEREELTALEIEYWEQHKHNCYNIRKPYLSAFVAGKPYRPPVPAAS